MQFSREFESQADFLGVEYMYRAGYDPQALTAWVAQQVPEYKHLVEVVLCDAIPKTPSGKILRRVLRAQDAARTGGAT